MTQGPGAPVAPVERDRATTDPMPPPVEPNTMAADALVLPSPVTASEPATAGAAAGRRRPVDRHERRIARGLREGDERALAELHRRHGAAVFGLVLRVVGDRATAEDVVQQVMTEVWRRGPQFDPRRASLLTWVLTIARSRAIDERRRRVPEPQDPHDAVRLADAAGAGGGADAMEGLVDRWRLAALLQELPGEERALLRLRFHGGFSQSEIAEQTGIPLGTVKTRMVRGLERLRAALEAEEGRR
jgi:RNA polymerase sigma-70 factor, ECF subfamily